MTATKAQRGAATERRRNLLIVQQRRVALERMLLGHPRASNARDVRRMIKMLLDIEFEIQAVTPDEKNVRLSEPQYTGDFTVEEMELAQAIIEEQDRNPFEV